MSPIFMIQSKINQMRKFCLITSILVILLICSRGLDGQIITNNLDQLKLGQAFVGNWQLNIGKDTVEMAEIQRYGKAFVNNVFVVINGKKSFSYIEDFGYSSKESKFKGFMLYQTGGYQTWLGSFISENKFTGDFVRNFDPATISGKFEILFEPAGSMTIIVFNTDGIKGEEYKYFKVK
jgi:hypothetical protein